MDRYLVLICTAIAATPAAILLLVTILIGVGLDNAIEIMQLVINGVIATGTIATAIVALYALNSWKDQLNLQNIRNIIDEQFIRDVDQTINEYWKFRNDYCDKILARARVIMEGTILANMKDEKEYPQEEASRLANIKYSVRMKINNIPEEIVEQFRLYEKAIRNEISDCEELQQEINNLIDYVIANPEKSGEDIKEEIEKIMRKIDKSREEIQKIHLLPLELIKARE
ncbi:hypothetical protein [Thalassolituus oleivorans]|uniref:hypothetical protein n=1 Tax=Thalassolituus oleivorans TaxID=187493 RepID=UPI001CE28D30|nr:hypothetical protein [Thalassolituus oleivorans]MCA6128776.1 hypothetical protein [Thalassolituus oleivorans 4BN06-13]